jgi:hypothetical protein
MHFLDLAALALGSIVVVIFYVAQTNIEKSRVPVKVKSRK